MKVKIRPMDLSGNVFGKLTVVKEAPRRSKYERCWECLCSCGTVSIVRQRDLRSGNTSSCGCSKVELLSSGMRLTHGYSRTSEHNSWKTMLARCSNENATKYPRYGGRGIKVCDRWLSSFENFIHDLGPKPGENYSLDRIDNDGDYSPENCRWSSDRKQAINRSDNVSSEEKYLRLLKDVIKNGQERSDRTGTGTLSIFAPASFSINNILSKFPLLTTRKLAWSNMVSELLWFISGSTNALDLPEEARKWWTPWADKDGELGPTYGALWRRWPAANGTVDQLCSVVEGIKKDPFSRRLVINTWHPGEIEHQNLPPCHGLIIQFYVEVDGFLSCQVYQRSADIFIGLPYNIASYSLLLAMISQVSGLDCGTLTYCVGDLHLYKNHLNQAITQLSRETRPLPKLELNPSVKNIDDFKFEDISLIGYNPHPAIKALVSI